MDSCEYPLQTGKEQKTQMCDLTQNAFDSLQTSLKQMMCGTNTHLHVFKKYVQVSFSGVPDFGSPSRTMRQAPPTIDDIMHIQYCIDRLLWACFCAKIFSCL